MYARHTIGRMKQATCIIQVRTVVRLSYNVCISSLNSTLRHSVLKKWKPQILYLLSWANVIVGIDLPFNSSKKSSFHLSSAIKCVPFGSTKTISCSIESVRFYINTKCSQAQSVRHLQTNRGVFGVRYGANIFYRIYCAMYQHSP